MTGLTRTRRLDAVEQRVLGALMEKEKTTPDVYPMSVNGLIAACNQKSNRTPVLELAGRQVRDALERLRKDVLVWRLEGGRVEKWEHRLASRWRLDPPAQAVMTLLLLRGAQTPGELRVRSERLHGFGAVEEVEATLRGLAVDPDPLVRELPREPGQRENRWVHVMGSEEESSGVPVPIAAQARKLGEAVPARAPSSPTRPPEPPVHRDADAGRLAAMEERLARLEDQVAELLERLGGL